MSKHEFGAVIGFLILAVVAVALSGCVVPGTVSPDERHSPASGSTTTETTTIVGSGTTTTTWDDRQPPPEPPPGIEEVNERNANAAAELRNCMHSAPEGAQCACFLDWPPAVLPNIPLWREVCQVPAPVVVQRTAGGRVPEEPTEADLTETLKEAEGHVAEPYRDHLGNCHTGYGRLVPEGECRRIEDEQVLREQQAEAEAYARGTYPNWDQISPARRNALTELHFWRGVGAMRGEDAFTRWVRNQNWTWASEELLRFAPCADPRLEARCARLAAALKEG